MWAYKHTVRAFVWGLLLVLAAHAQVYAERIKDLVSIGGVRDNPLIGYGLVVGLDGSGDQTTQAPFTTQSLKSTLTQLGVTIPPGVNPQLKNAAAVIVQATLPPFSKTGQRIDVTVSSIGNAASLRGGSLLLTPLKAWMGTSTRSPKETWPLADSASTPQVVRVSPSTFPVPAVFPMVRSWNARCLHPLAAQAL